ncbi:MAG TPA: SGNH/GDSL hydrolase family protein [Pirellulales bacterium]
MSNLVLLGDSIFDNHAYVHGGPAVIDHVRRGLPIGWQATLLARDGAMTTGVSRQLEQMPLDGSHLVVSAGGNDVLEHASMILYDAAASFNEVMSKLAKIQSDFRAMYREMIEAVVSLGKPTFVCTVYDAIPGLEPSLVAALSLFNDVILREAIRAELPAVDLRQACTDPADYAGIWPIEPSATGGAKIASAVLRAVATPWADRRGCHVFRR